MSPPIALGYPLPTRGLRVGPRPPEWASLGPWGRKSNHVGFRVWDIQPQDSLVVCLLVQQDPLYRAGVASFQDDNCVVHPHEPREAKRLYRRGPVRDIPEAQERESCRCACMDPLDSAVGGTQELGQGTRLPGAQWQGVREALTVGGEVVSLS